MMHWPWLALWLAGSARRRDAARHRLPHFGDGSRARSPLDAAEPARLTRLAGRLVAGVGVELLGTALAVTANQAATAVARRILGGHRSEG